MKFNTPYGTDREDTALSPGVRRIYAALSVVCFILFFAVYRWVGHLPSGSSPDNDPRMAAVCFALPALGVCFVASLYCGARRFTNRWMQLLWIIGEIAVGAVVFWFLRGRL